MTAAITRRRYRRGRGETILNTPRFDPAEFLCPDRTWRPTLFWAWNDRLDPDELIRQIHGMHEQGLGGFFMHSRSGLITEYMSDAWMEAIRVARDEARRTDMIAWLYDEDRWPSGFAGGVIPALGDAYRLKCLEARLVPAHSVRASLADPATLGVFAVSLDSEGNLTDVPVPAHEVGVLADEGRRFLSIQVALGERSNWHNGESYVDLLAKNVTERFLELTYDAYAQYADADSPGIFTDEPTIHIYSPERGVRLPWTTALPDAFVEQNGYDLLAVLPLLYLKGKGWEKTRYDFWKTVTRLFVGSFAKPCFERAEKLGFMCTGHFLYEERLLLQIVSNGSVMPLYEYQHMPGIDHLGPGIGDEVTYKQVASVAHQFGRRRVLSELYGTSGQALTFEDQKWIADFHLVLGVNFFTKHLSLYSMVGERKRDYPPTFSYQQPYWKTHRIIHDYIARCSYAVALGEPQANILVLHPVATGWTLLGAPLLPTAAGSTVPEPDYERALDLFTRSEASKHAEIDRYDREFAGLIRLLLEEHRDFDLGDELIMERHARLEDSWLRIGQSRYRVIIIPPSLNWSGSTVKLLQEFVAAGGRLLFVGEMPSMVDGHASDAYSKLGAESGPVVETLDRWLPRAIRVLNQDQREIGDVYCHHRRTGGEHVVFLANRNRDTSHSARILLRAEGGVRELDAATGAVREVMAQQKDEFLCIETEFPPVGSRIFIVSAGEAPVAEDAASAVDEVGAASVDAIPLDGVWEHRRLHANSLTLDYCSYAIDGDTWSESVPLWKARKAIQTASGMAPYEGMQPWALREKGLRPPPLPLALRYVFDSEVEGARVAVVIERLEHWQVMVNAHSVDTRSHDWHWDRQFGKVDISAALVRGKNTVEAQCLFGDDIEIEDAYLVGDFGVRMATPSQPVLSVEANCLRAGSWIDQGYPFYAGSMLYTKRVDLQPLGGRRARLRLRNPRGTCFGISVNSGAMRPLAWQPWEVDITHDVVSGSNTIRIEVASSLRNSFGPLHHTNANQLDWTGPDQFVDQEHWTDDYQFLPYGLLEGAEIVLSDQRSA